jgi:hypothetical protein
VTDFQLYDVPTTCRACGAEFVGKAFVPQGATPRFGLCPPCQAVDDEKMARLKQPPKDHGRRKPEPEQRVADRRYAQRRWEPE